MDVMLCCTLLITVYWSNCVYGLMSRVFGVLSSDEDCYIIDNVAYELILSIFLNLLVTYLYKFCNIECIVMKCSRAFEYCKYKLFHAPTHYMVIFVSML